MVLSAAGLGLLVLAVPADASSPRLLTGLDTSAASANDDMDMGADMGMEGTPAASAGRPSPSTSHSMDMGDSGTSVTGLGSGGGQQWRHPDQIAAASLVRIDTSVNVSVAVHAAHLHSFSFPLQAPDSTSTGFVVNPQGSVVTSGPALKDRDDQLDRYVIAAINEGFVRSGFLPQFSNQADLYRKTHVPADREAKEGNLNPSLDTRLQSCYNRADPMSHCALFMQRQITVTPITADAGQTGRTDAVKAWSDDKVAVVTTSDKYTPLTLTFEKGEEGGDYWMVGVLDGRPTTITGKLTSDRAKPLADADLATLWTKLGPAGAGSPLVSRTGAVVGMLGLAGDGFEVLPADHLARDAGRSGITLAAGPLDTQFRDGMLFFESQEYRSAHAQLEPVVKATGGQVVPAAMDAEAKAKAGTAADMTDMANSHTTMSGDDDSSSVWWWLLGAAVLAVLAAGGLWFTRQRWLPLLNRSDEPPPHPTAPAGGAASLDVRETAALAGPVTGRTGSRSAAEPAAHSAYGPPVADLTGPTRMITSLDAEPAMNRTPGGAGQATTILATPDLNAPPAVPVRLAPATTPTVDPAAASPRPSAPVTVAAPVAKAVPAPAARGDSFCVQCGSQLSPGDRFCYSCGTPVR